jgi:outer membrane receptor protein involved in Fe transport
VDDATGLDGVPPATLTLRVRRDFGRAWGWVRAGAYGDLDHPGPTEQPRPGYFLLDAGAGVRLGSRAELSVLGRNLLDEAYLASPDSRAVLAPGASAVVSLRLRF